MFQKVIGFNEKGDYIVEDIYLMGRMKKCTDGSLTGALEATGIIPTFMEEIEDNKIPFPRTKFAA